MNLKVEHSAPAPEQRTSNKKTVDRAPSAQESMTAETKRKYAKERVELRKNDAKKIVETQHQLEPNLDLLVSQFSKEVEDLQNKVDQLTQANTQLEESLELAREKYAYAQQLRQASTPTSAERPRLTIAPRVETRVEPTSPTPPGLLGRFNRWLRSTGRPEQTQLSQTAYDSTQTPSAQSTREQARAQSVEEVADRALEANRTALEQEKLALSQAQEQARNASFLTRWRFSGQIRALEQQIQFRESAIKAREAQKNRSQNQESQKVA